MQALLVIDVQVDFLPGGALAVPEGDAIVPLTNRLMEAFPLTFATQDRHPSDHGSFAANHPGRTVGEIAELAGLPQYLWPIHCVAGTPGAEFAPGLDRGRIAAIVAKGTDPTIDSYSGFFDNGRRKATGLADLLRANGVTSLAVVGLAFDYCVAATALDAVDLGFPTCVIEDACRAVDLPPGRAVAARAELLARGVELVRSERFLG